MQTAMNSLNGVATPNSLPLPTQFHASREADDGRAACQNQCQPHQNLSGAECGKDRCDAELGYEQAVDKADTSPISTASNMPMMV